MRNLTFGILENGLGKNSRILMLYSFETESQMSRSGILHYHLGEARFMGPRQDRALTSAALEYLSKSGHLPEAPSQQ